ncbi:chaplin [Streptomyces sp. RFCAC02]|uniref:chaplin n=1 Tax=Streptomyces sp. RFCAC02 TaxID=2499143 RepID=UPI00101EE2E2|nr:chaplin [Streptomyces sp. RFCAC02]
MNTAKKAALVLAAAGAALGAGAGSAAADAETQAVAAKSPGVISGNNVQIPIEIAPQLVGNSINVIGFLNPAFGNTGVID